MVQKSLDGAQTPGKVGQELAVVVDASNARAHLLLVGGHGRCSEGGDRVGFGAVTASGDGLSHEIGDRVANCGPGGGKIKVVLPEASEEGSDVGDVIDRNL